jgi:release factor glutamine methyltransferase
MSLTIQSAREQGAAKLSASPSPQEDVQLLLEHISGYTPTQQIMHSDRLLTSEQHAAFQVCLDRRQQGEPVAHITGTRGFWTLDLAVNAHTLIPRPDTELLVRLALEKLEQGMTVIDIGTGTGAIALAIASERDDVQVYASDVVFEAVKLAKQNAHRHQLERVKFIQMAWLAAVCPQRFDMVIANPPYIRESDEHLSEGDVRFEPRSALVSGKEGLDDIRLIVSQAKQALKPGGWCLVEHGYDQSEAVQAIYREQGFVEISAYQDWGQQDRAVMGRLSL